MAFFTMHRIHPQRSETPELRLPRAPTCFIGSLTQATEAVRCQSISHALVGPGFDQKKLASFERIRQALLQKEPIDYCKQKDFEQKLLSQFSGTTCTRADLSLLLEHVLDRVRIFEDGTGSDGRIWLRSIPSLRSSPFDPVRDRNFPLHFDFDDKQKDRTRLLETLAGESGTYFVAPSRCPYTRGGVRAVTNALSRYTNWMSEEDGREALSDLSNPHLQFCKTLERLGFAIEEVDVGISFVFTGNILHSGSLNYDSGRLLLIIDQES